MDNKFSIVVHGGAGPVSERVRKNEDEYKSGLLKAVEQGYSILESGGSAVDAVEAAVRMLEDNPLFNAGRGSALNAKGEVEMDASIMDGNEVRAGAVTLIKNVKNPVTLARVIMDHSPHVFMGAEGAIEYAKSMNLEFESDEYFLTDHDFQTHGTVGAVACDRYGNIAAATSTGGIDESSEGRIGDSPVVGAGVYANNDTCAVSATGEGEYIIRHVLAHQLQSLVEYNNMPVNEAAAYLIYQKLKHETHDMGVIAVDRSGTIGMAFNSERMHRAWKTSDNESGVKIYPD
jgi:beta-aspartyl-peptidase (threonine type)